VIWLSTAVLFLVYLNAPAVAVRVHGAPFALGALVPLALVVPVAWRVLVRGEELRFPNVLLATALMLALHGLSAVFSVRPMESMDALEAWLVEGLVLAWLIANAVRTRAEVMAAAGALVAAGAVMGAIALAQQVLGPVEHPFFGFGQLDSEISDAAGRVTRRLAGPIGETNRFAQIMAVLIPIAVGCGLATRDRTRWLWLGAAGLVSLGMLFAFSRGAIVALALVVPFAVAFRLVRMRQVVVAGVLGVLLLFAMPHYAQRVASLGEIALQALGVAPGGLRNADGAARGRLTEMKSAGLLFLDHPLLGAGPGLAPLYYEQYAGVVGGKVRTGTRRSHNLYLQLAAETGVVGLGAFLFCVGLAFQQIDRARRRFERGDRGLWGLACGLELALMISLTTSLFLHAAYIRYFWILMGLVVATSVQPGVPALAAFLSRMLRETAQRIRADA